MNQHEDDAPREHDTGMGYPEEGPPGSGMDPREHSENDVTPEHDDAPQADADHDGDPGQATGNPRAAGGDE